MLHRMNRFVFVILSAFLVTLMGFSSTAALAAPQPSRTLLLTERFTPTQVPAKKANPKPEALIAARGEREGFQFALRNTTPSPLFLNAEINGDNALNSAIAQGKISFELLRVGMVHVPKGSTRLGTSAGKYADPLPPLAPEAGPKGLLQVDPGTWGGVAVIATVRTNAAAGNYRATLSLVDANGEVWGSTGFTLSVRNIFTRRGGAPQPLLQNGSRNSFKTVLNVEAEAYWLQHRDLRNGGRLWFDMAYPDRMAQLGGLFAFLDSRGVTPLETPFAMPSTSGKYNCSYNYKVDQDRYAAYSFIDQLKQRYFSGGQEVAPSKKAFPARFMPNRTTGCNPDSSSGGFTPTVDAGRKNVKQDDKLHTKAPAFWKTVASEWKQHSLWGGVTYVKNPFDEPSGANRAFQRTMRVEVPKATRALKKATDGRAKVVLADWPRKFGKKRICRKVGKSQHCTDYSFDEYSNEAQWDGKGTDDPDVWLVPYNRLFGRVVAPSQRKYGLKREREYAERLAGIKKLRGGREVWAYNFFTADKRMPQLTIDAPGTDPRLNYLILAREGHTGLFVSNLMMGWSAVTQNHPEKNLRRKGDPYEQATYFTHSSWAWGDAAGWGTFIYPGYRPELGLDGDARRLGEAAKPVSSLRLEGMRDGQEDANLVTMYRQRFGEQRTRQLFKLVISEQYVSLSGTKLGNVVVPKYSNTNMAQKMETLRRKMLNELSNPNTGKKTKKSAKKTVTKKVKKKVKKKR